MRLVFIAVLLSLITTFGASSVRCEDADWWTRRDGSVTKNLVDIGSGGGSVIVSEGYDELIDVRLDLDDTLCKGGCIGVMKLSYVDNSDHTRMVSFTVISYDGKVWGSGSTVDLSSIVSALSNIDELFITLTLGDTDHDYIFYPKGIDEVFKN